MFLHPVGSAGYVLHSGLSGVPSIDALFFMLRRAQCDFYKKRAKTYYAKLVVLHPTGSTIHIVHSGASTQ
jgi:hypothetical protein